jgi:hypothetical protein
MPQNVLGSTFFLTLLLAIGLFFFIRASVKDRIEEGNYASNLSEEALLPQIDAYFQQRAYRVESVDRDTQSVTFSGFVAPSGFLTVFLSTLAAGGAACLALVLANLLPEVGWWWGLLVGVSPLAGWFYRKNAARVERVVVRLSPQLDGTTQAIVVGHRDELEIFQESLQLIATKDLE